MLSILDVLSVYVNSKKLLSKMYIEGALMSKSRNIALIAEKKGGAFFILLFWEVNPFGDHKTLHKMLLMQVAKALE